MELSKYTYFYSLIICFSPLMESPLKEYLPIRSATKQATLRRKRTESAQLPGNHACQKYFSSGPGDGPHPSYSVLTLLQRAFLFLKPGHPGDSQRRKKVPISKGSLCDSSSPEHSPQRTQELRVLTHDHQSHPLSDWHEALPLICSV